MSRPLRQFWPNTLTLLQIGGRAYFFSTPTRISRDSVSLGVPESRMAPETPSTMRSATCHEEADQSVRINGGPLTSSMTFASARALELLRVGVAESAAEFRPGRQEAIRHVVLATAACSFSRTPAGQELRLRHRRQAAARGRRGTAARGGRHENGTVHLNWRIIQAPIRLVDYVVSATSAPATPHARPRLLASRWTHHAGLRTPPASSPRTRDGFELVALPGFVWVRRAGASREVVRRGYAGAMLDKDLYARILSIEAPWQVANVELEFHVAGHLGDAVDRVRRAEHRRLASVQDQRLKGSRYAWLRNPQNMDEDRWEQFAPLRSSALQTARAWAYKEHAMTLWAYRTRGWARRAWLTWYRSAIRCRLDPVKKAARMIKRNLDGIVTAVVQRVTNARAESINAGIQKVKYSARGFRSRKRFRNAIYFHLGGLDLYPVGVTP